MEIYALKGSIYERHLEENARAKAEQNAANIDFLAMMADIEIPTEGGQEDEQEL